MTSKSYPATDKVSYTVNQSWAYGRKLDNRGSNVSRSGPWYGNANSSRDGGYLPDWKARIKSHTNATTSFQGVKRSVKRSPGAGYCHADFRKNQSPPQALESDDRGYYDESWSGDILGIPGTSDGGFQASSLSASEAEAIALSSVLSNARSALSAMEGMTFIGELRETIGMIRRPAQALRSGIAAYLGAVKKRSKGDRKRSEASLNKVVSGSWLEFQFGWKPLIHDIQDAVKAAEELSQRSGYRAFRGEGRVQKAILFPESISTIGNYMWYWAQRRDTDVCSVRYNGYVRCRVGGLSAGAEAFGFTPSNILPTIWELIPYSFLVDYFSNVGDIVSAISFPTGSIAWCKRTQRSTYTKMLYGKNASYQDKFGSPDTWGVYTGSCSPGSVLLSQTTVTRTPIEALPVPKIRFKLPGSGRRWANIGALVGQSRSTERLLQSLIRR